MSGAGSLGSFGKLRLWQDHRLDPPDFEAVAMGGAQDGQAQSVDR